ncbi:hypothetical protein ACFFX1_52555 [Dactylosporangium sucinum]|uniref:Uncharacterized protein n=1 Tax=Dactylosporangium sucinum TaxID=1424081 RepID=A0A917UCH8_9ACTN|nr:hypothetical protein [Dactylosporangium sucinum]GGM77466.1 hypothetical protein GCM10007977_093650 [Dactylosporangium sucinum]GGM77767.1 hypothetical protein GCM10007977_094040 [Dactylosporangium sucinum]
MRIVRRHDMALRAFGTVRRALTRAPRQPAAEVRLERHKDDLPPRLNVG